MPRNASPIGEPTRKQRNRTRTPVRTSITAVPPTLRRPGIVLGPRATRTIASILDATRELLLARGYAGTTIDEITKSAGVSRASFYTYFPSKRDVLLALGTNSGSAALVLIHALSDMPAGWTLGDIEDWVQQYFEFLDEQGSFVFAWTQAAHEDEEIRVAGMRGHLNLCRRMGRAFAALGGTTVDDPAEFGLMVFSMLERTWAYSQLYAGTIDQAALLGTLARVLTAAVPCPMDNLSAG
jgi:AcrR family transcriptional regulator